MRTESIAAHDPTSGEGGPGAVDGPAADVDAARRAFGSGRTRAYEWRLSQLAALDRMLTECGPELEAALASDLGKAPVEALTTEIGAVRSEVTHARKHLGRWMRDRAVRLPLTVRPAAGHVRREPLGVVVVIAPWNYPLNLLLSPLVGALAAGNAVVLKPSEVSAATSAVVARLLPRYLDAEAVRVVQGGVEETTALLECRVDHVLYTGNGEVGRIVMAAAARHLTPVTLELGGKSPVWVDESADLARTAEWLAWGKFLNAGQTCVAPDYVLATEPVLRRLVPILARATTRMYGEDPSASPDYGRIVSERHARRLVGLLGSGRVALGGGHDVAARYVAPTLLTDVGLDDAVMREEVFGPILPLVAVADLDEALEIIDARDKPLALYAFTEQEQVREQILARTSSGSVAFNATIVQISVPDLPFGGVGASGTGSYHGEAGMRTFSHERSVLRRRRGPDLLAAARPPFTRAKRRVLRRMLG